MIPIKTPDELKVLRSNAALLAAILEGSEILLKPGVLTIDIDDHVRREILLGGAEPSFVGYPYVGMLSRPGPYEFATFVSVNDEAWAKPGLRVLNAGDLVTVETGLRKNDFHAVAEYTYGVGRLSPARQRLLAASRLALQTGVSAAASDRRVSAISYALTQAAESHGYDMIREFVGSGVGRAPREEPMVPCFAESESKGPVLRAGMVLHVLSIIKAGKPSLRVLDNDVAVSTDGTDVCSNGHVVAVTEQGPEILTPGPWERHERTPLVAAVNLISKEMIAFLARHPEALYRLDPKVFEKLVGALLESHGFSVQFNVQTTSGEVDIIGVTRDVLGNRLGYVVECKRYARHRRVKVSEVTRLYGIKESLRQSWGVDRGLVVTTSDFTRHAERMGDRWDLDLRDHGRLVEWLQTFSAPRGGSLPFLGS